MLPFINVFGRDVPMYGICMITGAFFAILFACLAAKKKGLQRIDVLLASFFCFIFGLIGAKILYIITDIPKIVTHFKNNEFDWMWLLQRMANAGIVFYGGFLGGIFGGWIYVRMFRLDFWKHADAMIPYLALAHGFGRLGCFCAGCCYGRPLDPPFGWYFPNAIGAPHDISLFPVQLFEACFLFIVLFPLMLFYSRKPRLPGKVVGMYLTVYGIFRFFNEFMRYDSIRGIFGGVSTSQWISLALVPIGILLLSGKISGALVSRYRGYAANAGEYEDDGYGEDGYAGDGDEDGFVPPCAVCTGCGECDRRRQEAAAKKAQAAGDGEDEEEEYEADEEEESVSDPGDEEQDEDGDPEAEDEDENESDYSDDEDEGSDDEDESEDEDDPGDEEDEDEDDSEDEGSDDEDEEAEDEDDEGDPDEDDYDIF